MRIIVSVTGGTAIDQIESRLTRFAQRAVVLRHLVESKNELAPTPHAQHAVTVGANPARRGRKRVRREGHCYGGEGGGLKEMAAVHGYGLTLGGAQFLHKREHPGGPPRFRGGPKAFLRATAAKEGARQE